LLHCRFLLVVRTLVLKLTLKTAKDNYRTRDMVNQDQGLEKPLPAKHLWKNS